MNERAWCRWMGWTVVAIVAADWISKFLVVNHLAERGQAAIVEGWVYLVHQRNAGVSFSFLGGAHGWWRTPFLVAVACVGIAVLAQVGRALPGRAARLAVALMMAGAIGNLGDRLVNGGVTDFLLLRWFPFVFNVADVAITGGAILFGLTLLRRSAPPAAA